MCFSLVAEIKGYYLVVVHRFLIAMASLVLKHGLEGVWASVLVAYGVSSCGFWALVQRLNFCGSWA